jgi:hypothetical protein
MFFTNPVISGCKAHAGGGVFLTRGRLVVTGRGLHSSTFQLNLSRSWTQNTP